MNILHENIYLFCKKMYKYIVLLQIKNILTIYIKGKLKSKQYFDVLIKL